MKYLKFSSGAKALLLSTIFFLQIQGALTNIVLLSFPFFLISRKKMSNPLFLCFSYHMRCGKNTSHILNVDPRRKNIYKKSMSLLFKQRVTVFDH